MFASGFRFEAERLPLIAITADLVTASTQQLYHILIFASVQVARLCNDCLFPHFARCWKYKWREHSIFDFLYHHAPSSSPCRVADRVPGYWYFGRSMPSDEKPQRQKMHLVAYSRIPLNKKYIEFIYHACSKKLDYSGVRLRTINIHHKNYSH